MNLNEELKRIKNVIQMISESNYLTKPMKLGLENNEINKTTKKLKLKTKENEDIDVNLDSNANTNEININNKNKNHRGKRTMADKNFIVKNGFVVNTNLIWANNGQIGFNTNTPDANVTIVGTANEIGRAHV